MNAVENSYEGAIRRMRRLGFEPGAELELTERPPRVSDGAQKSSARMRELEELATLACEENERLEAELAAVRVENTILVQRIAALQAPTHALVPAYDELGLVAPPRKRGGRVVLGMLGLALAGAGVFLVLPLLSPTSHVVVMPEADRPASAPATSPIVIAPTPVVTPTPVTPTTAAAPTIPVAPAAAAPKPAAPSTARAIASPAYAATSHHKSADHAVAKRAVKHARHFAKKSSDSARSGGKHDWAADNDPLGGLKL